MERIFDAMPKPVFLFSFLALVLLASCDDNRLYEENRELKDHAWTERDTLRFEFTVIDTASPYNFYFNLRNADDYPYSNIYVFMNTTFPNGKFRRDTVEFVLADQAGRWMGKGQGSLWDNQLLFRKAMRFPLTGKYKIEINQAMRRQSLPGISDAGIRIEKYKPE